ncbi:hypothetical protein HDA40_007286 [Hamadaea flava]|uniref:Uncharacterized protein n=1 Tax=Hamadaea flava TaxID=1742688 RepID=A0ABV8LV72_9ACTN|nr:hypothetical protein [Hamadaea flava]MCP2328779.1 hypothetical protein [Hamadaea flava]
MARGLSAVGGNRVLVLERQPRVGTLRKLIKQVVEVHEDLPAALARDLANSLNDAVFEARYPFGLPDLVGEADEEVLGADVGRGPCSVIGCEAGPPGLDARFDKQFIPCQLMTRAGLRQLGDVDRLADVVRRRAEQPLPG